MQLLALLVTQLIQIELQLLIVLWVILDNGDYAAELLVAKLVYSANQEKSVVCILLGCVTQIVKVPRHCSRTIFVYGSISAFYGALGCGSAILLSATSDFCV